MTILPPPPAPDDRPSGTATTFPPPTGAQVLRALRAPAVGYAWLLAGALALMVLVVVAAAVGSTADDTGVESDDVNALGVLVGMPFQIAGMALLGSLHFTKDGVSASLFLPPLLLTALYVVMTARSAGRGEAVPVAGTRALLGAIVGFAAAVVVTLLTLVLAMRAEGAAVHAASVSQFFGIWVLTAVASYVGTTRASGAPRAAWIPTDYRAAATVWGLAVAVWLVVAGVVATVAAAVEEDLWLGVLAPVWAPTAGLYTYALAHLGGLSFGGETVMVGELGALWTILMVVGALALSVASSLAWHLRRDTRATSLAQPGSWAVLPATYAVGGMVVWLVPSVVLGGGWGMLGGSVTLQPAFWIVFVLAAWGAAIEVASRFLAPSLVPALPPRVRTVLRGREPVATPAAPDGVPTAAAPSQPLTAEERARYKKLGIAAGAVVAVLVVGGIAVSVVNDQFFGPEDQAAAYLDAVVDADLEEVTELAPVDDDLADAALLRSDVYRAAESRITGYELGDVEEDGDTVRVDVRLEGLDGSDDAELSLEQEGQTAVLFDSWRVAEGGLAAMVTVGTPEGAGELAVNGVTVDGVEDDVWLLPGSYVFDAFADNEWLESSGEPVTVAPDEEYQYADMPAAVASDAFRTEVQRQIDAYLEECMAATELEPEGCPNEVYAGTDVRDVTWTLEKAPTADFDSFDGTFPADLSYGDFGRASVTYESDESYGFGRPDWEEQSEEADLYLDSVVVTEAGDGLMVSFE